MPIQSESYDAIHDQYTAAIAWMSSIGVKLGSGRLVHYEKVVGTWTEQYRTATEEQRKDVFPDFVSSMFEIHDFVDVFYAFSDVPKQQLGGIIQKLNKGVNGPIDAADETQKSTQSRNFLFEAATAARLHRPELGIEAMLESESDTGLKVDGTKIWIECKRVTTVDKIYDNVRKATRQLERIFARKIGSKHRGMAALDVSKILQAGDQIFVKDTESELLASVDSIMDSFITQYYGEWEKVYRRRDKKIIGSLLRFAFMSSVKDRNILVHTSQWGVNPSSGATGSDSELIQTLAANLTTSPRR